MHRLLEVLATVPERAVPVQIFDEDAVRTVRQLTGERITQWALDIAARVLTAELENIAPSRREMFAPIIGANTESISLNLLRHLYGVQGASAPRVSKAQRFSIMHGVRESVELSRQTKGIRRLELEWKRAFTALIIADHASAEALELLNLLDERLSQYFDTLNDENARFFADEQQRLLEQQLVGQRKLLERIVKNLAVEDQLAAEILGISPSDVHYGFVVESAAAAGRSAPALDLSLFRRSFEARFRDRLITLIPDTGERSWVFVSGAPLSRPELLARVDDILASAPGSIVSLGSAGQGIAGLRMTHLTALAAHKLNVAARGAGPLVDFDEHGLLCLAVANPELAHWFVRNEIGPLLADTPFNEELRVTLLTLLEHSGAHMKAADELYVHRNTISHRLKRLEELLGRDPLSRPLETHAALLMARLLRPAA